MNKIVRSTPGTLCGIRRSKVRVQTAIFAAILLKTHGGAQPGFAQAAISECARAFCHPGADALKACRPVFSLDSANGSANERNSRIDGDTPTPQTSLRRAAPILSRGHQSYLSSASSSVEIDRLLCIALDAPFGHEMKNAWEPGMRDVLSLGAFIIMLLCLVVFVITLRPDVIRTLHAPSKTEYCNIGHSSAQECGLNVLAAARGR
jgi:hypothetical protein